MLDYNHRPGFVDRINAAVDAALEAERAATPPRNYLGASRLGHACERALQFEFAGAPKDEGADFGGQTLRIFAIGHELEDLEPLRACRRLIFVRYAAMTGMAIILFGPMLQK